MIHEHIKLLVVEDNIALAQNLDDFFEDERYTLDFATDGLTAIHLIAINTYDAIILDVMLPGLNGFEICRRLREDLKCQTAVIMMTAKDQIQDKEQAYQYGADDYLIKPFNLRELQLRVEAIYRRSKNEGTQQLLAGNIAFDPGTLKVCIDGYGSLELSGTAAHIFEIMMRTYPNFVSYTQLNEKLWGDRDVDLNVLRTHVYTLRKQLQKNFGEPLIKTIHGRGYALTSFNGS